MHDKTYLDFEDILAFMEHAPANIFFKDNKCRYCFVTEMCNLVNGGKENSILGKTDQEIQKFADLGRFYYEDDKKILSTGKESCYVNAVSLESGTEYYEIKKNPVFKNGKIIGIIGVINNVTKEKQMEKQLEELSFKDKLTGLKNRNYMESRCKNYARQEDFPLSLIMLDCNYLKKTNDTLGHEYGDLLLKRVANILVREIPKECTPMHIGGDEFLILCPKFAKERTEMLITKLRHAFLNESDATITLDASIGYFVVGKEEIAFDEAFRRADIDMYEEKKRSHEKK